MTKDFCVKALQRVKGFAERKREIYKLGVDLTEFGEGITDLLVESIAMLVSTGDENFKYAIELTEWWLYENVPKVLYSSDDKQIIADITEPEDLVQYMIDNYND